MRRTGKSATTTAPTTTTTMPTASTDARNRLAAGNSPTIDFKRIGLSLGLVLGVIFVARFAMKRLFPAVSVGRHSQVIRVVSRSVIGPKQQFLLVKLGKRLVLVGDSGTSMSPLAEIDDPAEVAELVGQLQSESTHSSAGAFASIFRKAETQFEAEPTETASQIARRELLAGASEQDPADAAQQMPDRKLVAVASEINGLMDRVRFLSNRIRGS